MGDICLVIAGTSGTKFTFLAEIRSGDYAGFVLFAVLTNVRTHAGAALVTEAAAWRITKEFASERIAHATVAAAFSLHDSLTPSVEVAGLHSILSRSVWLIGWAGTWPN